MRIGVYDVLLELGRGGMGAVYLARLSGAGEFERLVAIKRALPQSLSDEDTRERFLHEARLAAYVHHANVVGIHQVGTDAVGPYLACDYVEGESLAGLIERTRKEARIPPPVALRIVIDALAGLSAIHDAVDGSGRTLGVLHRDVSIENLLIGRDGVTRITDFGIAKSVVSPVRTDTGAIHGKLLYLTPEYLHGNAPDRTCDTYAMGITLFAALTSTYPFRTEDMNFLIEQIVSAAMPTLRSRGVDASPELEAVLAKAVSRDRNNRFQDASSMLEALERAALTSGGVARQQEVAAFVERVAGKELRARREAIQARRSDALAAHVAEPSPAIATPPLPETLVDARTDAQKSQSSLPPTRTADARMTIAAMAVLLLGVAGFFYLERTPPRGASGVASDTKPVAADVAAAPRPSVSAVPSPPISAVPATDARAAAAEPSPTAATDASVAPDAGSPAGESAVRPRVEHTTPARPSRPPSATPVRPSSELEPAKLPAKPPEKPPAKPPENPDISLNNPYR